MEGEERISVRRGDRLVPLLTESPHAAASHPARAAQPWRGVLLESHSVARGEIPEHEHPSLCLHLQTAGAEAFEWWSDGQNRVERTRPGSLILIPPGTADRLHWRGASQRTILTISPAQWAALAEGLELPAPPELRGAWSLDDAGLGGVLAEMAREAGQGWPLGALYADLLTLRLGRQLMAAHAASPVRLPELAGGLGATALRRVLEFLNAHLDEELHLDAVAAAAGLSASQLAHGFRRSTGRSPYQYVLDQRMARAQALLRTTAWSVQAIAATVGFGSATNFVRAFRQRVGTTPEAWRRGV